jgi:outer membrane lipoprotein SlyB
MTQRIFALCLATMVLFTACSRNISSGAYDDDEAMTAVQTYEGKIINARSVTVSGKSGMTDNPVGLLGGGALGAVAGSHMGNGGGIATLAGAAIGAIAGSFAEKGIKGSQTGMEYTVKLTNGQLKTITQGPEPLLQKGQKVLVQIASSGKSRVVALS